jgi:glycosyltransferase involved in cell wall biosynthesis
MIGSFVWLTNYVAYRWGKKRKKKIIVFTETFRKNGMLRERSIKTILLELAYKHIDALFTSNEDATNQMKRVFDKLPSKTYTAQYPSDIEDYLEHPIREGKNAYVYLFPNRLINIYNPLLAIDIFYEINRKYPSSKLLLNTMGELYDVCIRKIERLNLNESVEFLTNIKSWNEMHLTYRKSDILIFPATFSNGNFTVLECMASGMGIVISNRILGMNKLIANGVNGYVCNPDKVE